MAGRLLSRHVRSLNACIGSPRRVTITQIRNATCDANRRDPVVSERPDNLGGLGSTEKEHVRCESGTEEENSLRGGFPSAPDGELRRPRKSQQNGGERKNDIYQQQGSGYSSQPHDGQHKQIDTPQDVHHFLQLAERDLAGPAEATALLKSSMEAIQSPPRKEQQVRATSVKASLVLHWILGTDPKQWDWTVDRNLADPLCWHLEAEEKSQAVQDWIWIWYTDGSLRDGATMKPKAAGYRSKYKSTTFDWPAQVIAAMARAMVYWSKDGTADNALKFVLDRSRYARGFSWYHYANTVVAKALDMDQARPCNPILFEEFVEVYRRRLHRIDSDEASSIWLDVANLKLFHPINADAKHMLAICRKKRALKCMLEYDEIRRVFCARLVLRAAYLLRLQGDQHNARYMEDVSVRLNEKPWTMRARLYGSWKRDPKLKRLHEESPFTEAV
ncbi:unnamed protein product [Cercospora beticola]|nr:unnamed protein product [Cercospora beticola]